MAKKKVVKPEERFIYVPPPEQWYFYLGEKYYKRLQPIPYKKEPIPKYVLKFRK
jgi:hypothetical protein